MGGQCVVVQGEVAEDVVAVDGDHQRGGVRDHDLVAGGGLGQERPLEGEPTGRPAVPSASSAGATIADAGVAMTSRATVPATALALALLASLPAPAAQLPDDTDHAAVAGAAYANTAAVTLALAARDGLAQIP